MNRFTLTAVAAVVFLASLASSANAAVHFTRVTPNGVVRKSVAITPVGLPKVTRTFVGPNGGSVSKSVVHGPVHTHVKTTVTRPNGASLTVRVRR